MNYYVHSIVLFLFLAERRAAMGIFDTGDDYVATAGATRSVYCVCVCDGGNMFMIDLNLDNSYNK